MEWLAWRLVHLFVIKALLVVIRLPNGAVYDVHLNEDDRAVCGAEHSDESFGKIEPRI